MIIHSPLYNTYAYKLTSIKWGCADGSHRGETSPYKMQVNVIHVILYHVPLLQMKITEINEVVRNVIRKGYHYKGFMK